MVNNNEVIKETQHNITNVVDTYSNCIVRLETNGVIEHQFHDGHKMVLKKNDIDDGSYEINFLIRTESSVGEEFNEDKHSKQTYSLELIREAIRMFMWRINYRNFLTNHTHYHTII